MNLTDHFTLEELTHSDTAIRLGIDQTPSPDVMQALTHSAECLEEVRSALGGHPLRINSGYRSPALNKAVGGAATSDHLDGWAVDFTCPDFGTPKDIAKFLSECPDISFHQCIYEGTWVHISFKPTGKREVLTAHFEPGRTYYTVGIA